MDEALSIAGLISSLVGGPAIILWLLNRKDANRKLDIDHDALSIAKFSAQLEAYQDLLNRSHTEIKELQEKVANLEEKEENNKKQLRVTSLKLEAVYDLFMAYVQRTGIPLTQREMDILNENKPHIN